jgi:uncharacterized protein (DUF1697 family)
MSATHVALLRGINVGKAKRVAMADLRAIVAGLGCRDVRTLLNSGNVVFTAAGKADPDGLAGRIEGAVRSRLGVTSRVIVLAARDLQKVLDENPLLDIANNPSRLIVSFLAAPADRARLRPLSRTDWSPEVLAIGTRAAYIWSPDGVGVSRLWEALGLALGDAVTTRNWATVLKLQALVRDVR